MKKILIKKINNYIALARFNHSYATFPKWLLPFVKQAVQGNSRAEMRIANNKITVISW